jgi:hypothetical protein
MKGSFYFLALFQLGFIWFSSGLHQVSSPVFFDEMLMTVLMSTFFSFLITYTVFIKIIKVIQGQHFLFRQGIKPSFLVVLVNFPVGSHPVLEIGV